MDLDELPENPVGWTRRMLMHMNFGEKGGSASFEVKDQEGNVAPFCYQYDTRKGGLTGFTLPGVEGVMTWGQLRAKWPEWRAEQENGESRQNHDTEPSGPRQASE